MPLLACTVAAGGSFGDCRGKRLDSLVPGKTMAPSACTQMGGNCCAIWMIGNHPSGSDSPSLMGTNPCYACYNTNVKSYCTGQLVRTRVPPETYWWVTASYCIKKGGTCCKPGGPQSPYDPRNNSTQVFCNYCYDGAVTTTTTGTKTCSGKMVASVDYTAKDCTYFGGRCCDMQATTSNPSSGGSAYCPFRYQYEPCHSCFSGPPA